MADEVQPSIQGESDAFLLANVLYRGVLGDWIQESNAQLLADHATDIDNTETPLDAFDATYTNPTLEPTIGTGEGFVGGAYIATDDTHVATLDAFTDEQTVYVGWDYVGTDSVTVGTVDEFNTQDPRVAIWEFDTDGDSITAARDQRPIGEQHDIGPIQADDGGTLGRWLSTALEPEAIGTPGDSTGEAFRVAGGTSDLIFGVDAGDGVFALTYNAYLDSGDWLGIVDGPAFALVYDASGTSTGVRLRHTALATADDPIQWHDLRWDAGTLTADGTVVFDGQAGEIPTSVLGGAAGNLDTYPVPPSDLDGTEGGGSAGDILQSDGTNAEWVTGGGGSGGLWTHIHSHDDSIDTNQIVYDSDVLAFPTYDMYRIESVYVNHESNNNNALNMRFNGDASSSYSVNGIDFELGEFIRLSNRTEFQRLAETDAEEIGQLIAICRGLQPQGADSSTFHYPTVTFDVATTFNPGNDPTDFIPHNGRLRTEHETVNRIEMWTTGIATGDINVYGRDI